MTHFELLDSCNLLNSNVKFGLLHCAQGLSLTLYSIGEKSLPEPEHFVFYAILYLLLYLQAYLAIMLDTEVCETIHYSR